MRPRAAALPVVALLLSTTAPAPAAETPSAPVAAPAPAPPIGVPATDDPASADVERYHLQSNAWVNLHQRLMYEARFGDSEAASEAEVAEAQRLADEIRAAFAEAEAAARRKRPSPRPSA